MRTQVAGRTASLLRGEQVPVTRIKAQAGGSPHEKNAFLLGTQYLRYAALCANTIMYENLNSFLLPSALYPLPSAFFCNSSS